VQAEKQCSALGEGSAALQAVKYTNPAEARILLIQTNFLMGLRIINNAFSKVFERENLSE